MNNKSFTIEYPGIVNSIKTKCAVFEPFDTTTDGIDPIIKEYTALWDTGATISVITPKIVKELNLECIGYTRVDRSNGNDIVGK